MGDEKLLQEIGSRICARRKEIGLTQEQMADRMDVSTQMISNLELGKKAIRPENLVKVCAVLNVSADYVLMGKHSDSELSALLAKIHVLSEIQYHVVEMLVESYLDTPPSH